MKTCMYVCVCACVCVRYCGCLAWSMNRSQANAQPRAAGGENKEWDNCCPASLSRPLSSLLPLLLLQPIGGIRGLAQCLQTASVRLFWGPPPQVRLLEDGSHVRRRHSLLELH